MLSELAVCLFGCLVAMAQAALLSRTVAATGSLIRSGPEAATGLRAASQPLSLRQLSSLFTSSSSSSINKRSAGALKTFALFNSKAKAKASEPKKVSWPHCGVGKMGMVKSNYGVIMGRVAMDVDMARIWLCHSGKCLLEKESVAQYCWKSIKEKVGVVMGSVEMISALLREDCQENCASSSRKLLMLVRSLPSAMQGLIGCAMR